jgi:hypothetical protein
VQRLGRAGVIEKSTGAAAELRGERLIFWQFAADGEGISDYDTDGAASRELRRIVEAKDIGGEIDRMVVTRVREVSDCGDASVGIVAVIVLVGNERADGIGVVAEHGFPGTKGERVERKKTQNEVDEQQEKHQTR